MSSSHSPNKRLAEAREHARIARHRFANSLKDTRRRLTPGQLKDDALAAIHERVEVAREDLRQTIRHHPFMACSAMAGLVAILFWKPARLAAIYSTRGARLVWLNRRLWRQGRD